MTALPYKPNTPLSAIILDGWSRGFQVTQTVNEAAQMGFGVTEAHVLNEWKTLQAGMLKDMEHDARQ